jgi:hypothetical protein
MLLAYEHDFIFLTQLPNFHAPSPKLSLSPLTCSLLPNVQACSYKASNPACNTCNITNGYVAG